MPGIYLSIHSVVLTLNGSGGRAKEVGSMGKSISTWCSERIHNLIKTFKIEDLCWNLKV